MRAQAAVEIHNDKTIIKLQCTYTVLRVTLLTIARARRQSSARQLYRQS